MLRAAMTLLLGLGILATSWGSDPGPTPLARLGTPYTIDEPVPKMLPAPDRTATASTAAAAYAALRPALAQESAATRPNLGAPIFEDSRSSNADRNQGWLSADYLMWWTQRGPLDGPLVTTGPPASNGILGNPGTRVLFDDSNLDSGALSGLRISGGWWLDRNHTNGIEASGFIVPQHSRSFLTGSGAFGVPVLARPTLVAGTGVETSEFIAFPDAFAGGIRIESASRLGGFDVNWLYSDPLPGVAQFHLLAGFRYLQLEESLHITQRSDILALGSAGFGVDTLFTPDSLLIQDSFRTANRFYGGQVGAKAHFQSDLLSLDVTGKLAFGYCQQSTTVEGATTHLTPFGPVGALPGGLLALPTNSGHFHHGDFAVVPEIAVNARLKMTRRVYTTLGYNLLYWSSVLRPGNQIDRNIDRVQLPSSLAFDPTVVPLGPLPRSQTSGYWAQGFNFGLEFTY